MNAHKERSSFACIDERSLQLNERSVQVMNKPVYVSDMHHCFQGVFFPSQL